MALYLITHVQLDRTGEVARVRWLAPDHSDSGFALKFDIVDVADAVAALDRGDVVELRFDGPQGPVPGGRLTKKRLLSGAATIAETHLIPRRSLHDLPRI